MAQIVCFADGQPFGPQDVVGGDEMEIKVRRQPFVDIVLASHGKRRHAWQFERGLRLGEAFLRVGLRLDPGNRLGHKGFQVREARRINLELFHRRVV